MAPRRRSLSRSARGGASGVPEQADASGDPVLREQLNTLMGVVQRQEEQIKELHELLTRQAAAAAPVAARRAPSGVAVGLGAVAPGSVEMEAERERAVAVLMAFKKFKPPTFDGESADPWVLEMWIDSMETLFEDLYTVERDKVNLAAHCLEKSAKVWWKGVKRDRLPSLPPMTWDVFRGLVFSVYFPDSEKRRLQEKFRKLRQGDRTVREYEREFTRIVNCVPHVVQDDEDKADCFVRGLRPEVFRYVHPFKLQTFAEVVDRALWVEQGDDSVREEREFSRQEARAVRLRDRSGGQSSSRRPPDQSQSRIPKLSSDQSSSGCVICGGSHRARRCALREGRCFYCGQAGHTKYDCPMGDGQLSPIATTFPSSGQPVDVQPLARSGERGVRIGQPEGTRRAPSGQAYATQVEEPAAAGNIIAGMI